VIGRGLATAVALGLLLAGCSTWGKKPPKIYPPSPTPPVAAAPAEPPARRPSPIIRLLPPPPVKRACVPKNFPRAPAYPDTDAALRDAGGAADRYQLMAAGRVLRTLRLAELEKIIDGCR